MNLKKLGAALAVAACGWMLLGSAVPATAADRYDHYDRYYGRSYYEGHDRAEARRRVIVRDRLIDLGDRTRLADRGGMISRHMAARIYDQLDDVRDFLRGERYLSDIEYDRRMRDLDHAEYDLRAARGGRYGHYERSGYYR